MPETGSKKPKRVVALDGDKLGMVVGAIAATMVLALCFFYQKVDGITTAVRAGWAFVLAYGATFFLVRMILRTTLTEFVKQSRAKKAAKRSRAREEEQPASESSVEPLVPGEPPAGASPTEQAPQT